MNLEETKIQYPLLLDVTLALFVQGQKLLLARKLKKIGAVLWNGPGGKIEVGETPELAMIRESREELRVTPTDYRSIGEITFYFPSTPEWNMRCYLYLVSSWEGTAQASEEMADPTWFSQTELPWNEMWQDDKIWLPCVLRGETVRASFLLNEHNLIKEYELHGISTTNLV